METKIQEIRGHFGLPSQDASKEAKWRPRSSKMEPKWRPKGAKWRENGAPSDPKLIAKSMKNEAVECDGELRLGMGSTRFLMDFHWIPNRFC